MPSLQSLFFRRMVRRKAPPLHHKVTVEEIRSGLDAAGRRTKPPAGTRKKPIQIDHMQAQWITPAGECHGVMFYVHGGAYVAGSLESHSNMVAYFADVSRMEALLFEYRLAPEHTFPAALDDVYTAYRWLLDQGYAPEQIVAAGDSAGGGLTLALLVRLRDEGLPLPAAAMCLSPWADLAATGDSLQTCASRDPWLRPESVAPGAALYHGDHYAPDHPLVSPLYADLHGLPPVLFQVGDCEILLSDSVRTAEKIRQCGGTAELEVWKGMWHVFQSFTHHMPESRKAVEHMARFIEKYARARTGQRATHPAQMVSGGK